MKLCHLQGPFVLEEVCNLLGDSRCHLRLWFVSLGRSSGQEGKPGDIGVGTEVECGIGVDLVGLVDFGIGVGWRGWG